VLRAQMDVATRPRPEPAPAARDSGAPRRNALAPASGAASPIATDRMTLPGSATNAIMDTLESPGDGGARLIREQRAFKAACDAAHAGRHTRFGRVEPVTGHSVHADARYLTENSPAFGSCVHL